MRDERAAVQDGKGSTERRMDRVRVTCIHALVALALAATPPGLLAQEKRATAAELAATCGTALAHGYTGVEAEACNWYVEPCPVCGKKPSDAAEWCAPKTAQTADIATTFVDGMRADPALGTRSARAAVREILGKAYPCKH